MKRRFQMKKFLLQNIGLLFLFTIIGCIICFKLGTDANWDLANYHYYTVWAVLHNRVGFDIMPCGIQSYFNPLIDVPLYIMIKIFNDKCYLINILQSLPYGFCVFLTYKIAQLIFNGKYKKQLIFFSVLIGATGTLSIMNVGLSFGDMGIALLVLFALFIFLKNIFLQDSLKRSFLIFLSALFIGFSIGLKMSGTMFAIGIIGAEILFAFKFKKAVKIIFLTLLGILIGILITSGWWYYIVYNHFGNPFFPFRNDLYQSPLAATMSFLDKRHLPATTLQAIFYPIFWTFSAFNNKGNPVVDFYSSDIRWLLLYISVFILILGSLSIAFRQKMKNIINCDIIYLLTAMVIINYIFWVNTSGTLRYLQYMEFLSGIFIFTVFYIILNIFKIKNSKVLIFLGCILSIFIFIFTKHIDFALTRTELREKFLDFENFNLPDDSVLLYLGGFPGTIYMPFQNPKSRFIYLYGEMGEYNFIYGEKYIEKIRDMLKKADNKVYLLYSDFAPAYTMWKNNGVVDLDKNDFNCRPAKNSFNQSYYFCSLKDGKTIKIEG